MTNKKHNNHLIPWVDDIGNNAHVPFMAVYTDKYAEGVDGFGRVRVSEPETIFDSKFVIGSAASPPERKLPNVWDESITNNSGTASSVHFSASAAVVMTVGQNDTIIRQTHTRFNYQSGKSQLVNLTGSLGDTGSGITSTIGVFDGTNGMYFERKDGVTNVVINNNGTIERVPQTEWNINKMDGTGENNVLMDWGKSQIFTIEYEWLGTGGVMFALFDNRKMYNVHFFNKANTLTTGAYLPTPNLPLRYSITNTTSSLESIYQVCTTVMSEGGAQQVGVLRYESLGTFGASEITLATVGIEYGVVGLRLKAGYEGTNVRPVTVTVLNTSNGDFEWKLHVNPSVSGVTTWTDQADSAVQFGVNGGSITDIGRVVAGGYVSNDLSGQVQDIESSYSIGVSIAGVSDEFILSLTPANANQNVLAGLTWREA